MPSERLSSGLSGVAGEYFVAGELSRLGYIASITLRNTRGIDILASNIDATRSVGIQVKTRQDTGTSWMLTRKAEEQLEGDVADNLFYVFVSLNGGEAPTFHVVPRKVVADYVRTNHQRWLDTPGMHGQLHRDNAVRTFRDTEGHFRNAWHTLGLDIGVVP